jgi:glycyl-tRNA synthetase beta chain
LSDLLKIAFEKYQGHPTVQLPSGEKIEQVFKGTLEKSSAVLPDATVAENRVAEALFFLRERLEFYLRDACGFAYDVTNAVLATGWNDVVDALTRAQAVAKVRGTEDFDAISASVKRIKNILRQATETGKYQPPAAGSAAIPTAPAAGSAALPNSAAPAAAAESDAERVLAGRTAQLASSTAELCRHKQYDEALAALATIRRPLDDFFDKVMVMVDDPALRSSRLGLLQMVASMFQAIADFSEVVTERKTS